MAADVPTQSPRTENTAVVAEKPKAAEPGLLPPYKVLLHNDDVNAMDYVVRTIVELTPVRRLEALRIMLEAHRRGVSLLLVTHKERAELYREQFASKRLVVTIEPAEGS